MSLSTIAKDQDESSLQETLTLKPEGYRAVLKNKEFLALWIAQVLSQLGDRIIFVVFVSMIVDQFGTNPSLQSWLYVFFTIPAILLTMIAGVFVDRWNKKYILISTNIMRAVIIALLPFVESSLAGLYALAFCISSVTQFFVPAEATMIPMLVDKNKLLTANSLFTTTMMASIVFGFALGDPLINIFGMKSVHLSITGLFAVSAIVLLYIKKQHVVSVNVADSSIGKFKKFFEELKQGLLYIKNTPIILRAMLKLTILFSTIVALCILAITISIELLYPAFPKIGAQKFGYIVTYSGIGMVLGSLLLGKFLRHKSQNNLIFSGFLVMGIALCFLACTHFIPKDIHLTIPGILVHFISLESFDFTLRMMYVYLSAFVCGVGASFVAVPLQTLLQTSIPPDMRGKVFGVQFTLLSTASTLPALLAAYGVVLIGLENILMVIGLPLGILGILGLKHKLLEEESYENRSDA